MINVNEKINDFKREWRLEKLVDEIHDKEELTYVISAMMSRFHLFKIDANLEKEGGPTNRYTITIGHLN